jgi:hypothetical protein
VSGWKTWAAVILAFGYGIGGYFLGMHGGDQALYFINMGIGFLGVGHKIEKAAKTQQASREAYEKAQTDALADLVKRNTER